MDVAIAAQESLPEASVMATTAVNANESSIDDCQPTADPATVTEPDVKPVVEEILENSNDKGHNLNINQEVANTEENNMKISCPLAHEDINQNGNQEILVLRKTSNWQNIREKFQLVHYSLNQDLDCILKGFDEFLNAQQEMLDEVIRKGDQMNEILRNADEVDASQRIELMHLVKTCIDASRSMKTSLYPRVTTNFKLMASDVSKLKNIFGQLMSKAADVMKEDVSNTIRDNSFLVAVTHIIDPGEFYVVRCCDKERHDKMSSKLESEAPTYEEPTEIIKGQMYGVFSSKWQRGLCGHQCGIYQVGDKPPQKLHTFFLVDEGREVTIPSSLVRTLPEELASAPKMALRCTLNPGFQPAITNTGVTAQFRQAAQRGLMSMKILSQDSEILNVDLTQVLTFDGKRIFSLREALFKNQIPKTVEIPIRQYKPKFDVENGTKPTYLRVVVSFAMNPANVYVNVVDQEWVQYEQMLLDLQEELMKARPILQEELHKGLVCATQYVGQWYRILIEELTFEGVSVFYVDTGHRSSVPKDCCYYLPDKYLELPAQALRCVLNGLKSEPESRNRSRPQKSNKWARQALSLLRGINEKKGILGIESLRGHLVGKIDLSMELTAFSILYIDGEEFSMNHLLCKRGLAITHKKTCVPNIESLRLQLAPEIALKTTSSAEDGKLASEQSTSINTDEPASESSLDKGNSNYLSEGPLSTNSAFEEPNQIVQDSLSYEENTDLGSACETNVPAGTSGSASSEEHGCVNLTIESAHFSTLADLGETASSECICSYEATESSKGSSVNLQKATSDDCIYTIEATDSIQSSSLSVNLQDLTENIDRNSTEAVVEAGVEVLGTKHRERKASTQSVDAANCSVFPTRTGKLRSNALSNRNRGFSFSGRRGSITDSSRVVEEGSLGNKESDLNAEAKASLKTKKQKKPKRNSKDKGSKLPTV